MRLILAICILIFSSPVMSADPLLMRIVFVTQDVERPPVLSNLEEIPDDLGQAGAQLGLKDNNTTGRFLKQKYEMVSVNLAEGESPVAALQMHIDSGDLFFVLDVPAASLDLILTEIKNSDVLFFNARARDNRFRLSKCDTRMLHTIPSRAMLTDALAQFFVKKRWNEWFLISGTRPDDQLFAASLKRSAHKFGAKIVAEKTWDGARDARRTAQAEVPLLTQGEDYDILMVADELGDFGEYMMYRTFDPRPVAGTQGLFPTAWYWTVEQWGAAQLQSRFQKIAKRRMQERDYAAWAAVRSLGEAMTRTKSNEFKAVNEFIRSDDFQLAAFKGRKLSYRSWNGQLRQPIALTGERSLVAQPPLQGFMHQKNEMDTLGFDQPEVKCAGK